MLSQDFLNIPAGLIALLASSVSAALPYNPTRAFLSPNINDPHVYIFTSTLGAPQLLSLDSSSSFDASSPPLSTLSPSLPFLDDDDDIAYTPVIDLAGDLTVYVGNCADGAGGSEIWQFAPEENSHGENGTWSQNSISAGSTATDLSTMGANYLASGVSFSSDASQNASASVLYIFGGMCPTSTASADDWTSLASYSNMVLTLDPSASTQSSNPGRKSYQLGLSASRGPPVAEAGFTMTALQPTFSNSSSTDLSKQQNFVLVGGHTNGAFINMSQVALLSLPEQSWSFLPVDQPRTARTDLATRESTNVEPRSGHTAVLTADGNKIIIFGGWVGDINTPADPQLVVLETGEGYGGLGDWIWSIPAQEGPGLARGAGIYGHGAVMLPGNIMMVVGGYDISSSSSKSSKRDSASNANSKAYLFNTTSNTWTTSYSNVAMPGKNSTSDSGALESSSQKAGLGAGIALGFSALAAVTVVYLLYSRRLRRRRDAREQELRDLALGAQRYHSSGFDDGGVDGRGGRYPVPQMAQRSNPAQDAYPWVPVTNLSGGFGEGQGWKDNGGTEAERTGLLVEIPSPTRGLRRSLHSRAVYAPTPNNQRIHGPGSIHPIDERDEYEEQGSSSRTPRPEMSQRQYSDPFIDTATLASNPVDNAPQLSPARERELEVQGWVDDWQAAEAKLTGQIPPSRRSGSPDKSDRTSSTLSEQSTKSMMSANSLQHTIGSVSRSLSQRTADLLFGPSPIHNNALSDPQSSTTDPLRSHSPERQNSTSSALNPYRRSQSLTLATSRPQTDQFIVAPPTFPSLRAESEALLGDGPQWATPPESPIKTTRSASRATGWMGSVRRALTGTLATAAGTRARSNSASPERIDERSANSSPTKRHYPIYGGQGSELPRRAASASAAIWRRKRGPGDWDAEKLGPSPKKGEASETPFDRDEADGDAEWDVEAAVQNRLVQVMFTVPKERLRVVNVDTDGLSVSDAGGTVEPMMCKETSAPQKVEFGNERVGNGSPSRRVGNLVKEIEDRTGSGKGKEVQR